jgi:signal peptidase II
VQRAEHLPGNWQRYGTLLLSATLVVALDQLSKLWVRANLSLGQSLPEEGVLRLTYLHNSGGVFGLPAPRILWLVLSAVVIIAIFLLYTRYLSSSLATGLALGILLGGNLGNLADRLFLGYVTDFLDLHLWGSFHWPAFNLADSTIVIGVILLGYFLLRRRKQSRLEDMRCNPREHSTCQ